MASPEDEDEAAHRSEAEHHNCSAESFKKVAHGKLLERGFAPQV